MVYRKNKKHLMSAKRRARVRSTITRDVTKGVSIVKNTSKKYMPKVKKELEEVGSNVTVVAKKSVPMLQQASRKFFSLFGISNSKSRKNRKN